MNSCLLIFRNTFIELWKTEVVYDLEQSYRIINSPFNSYLSKCCLPVLHLVIKRASQVGCSTSLLGYQATPLSCPD